MAGSARAIPAEGMGGKDSGRGERIRTSGLYVPNVALYQAKLHPACAAGPEKLSGPALQQLSRQL